MTQKLAIQALKCPPLSSIHQVVVALMTRLFLKVEATMRFLFSHGFYKGPLQVLLKAISLAA